MIRIIIAVIFLIIFFLISIPIWAVMWVIRLVSGKTCDYASLRYVQWGFKVVALIAGVRLTVTGEENVPKDKAVLYVSNHQGFFDIILCYARVPALTGFISKKEWAKVPFLHLWMEKLHCLFLDRDSTRDGLKVILKAIEYIKSGISVFIYPEGTRSRDGALHEFKAGSFKIATKTDCPIIPVAVKNTAAVFEEHLPLLKATDVTISYGAPIIPSELDEDKKKHIGNYVHGVIEDMLAAQA